MKVDNVTPEHNPEQITKECHEDLKEMAFWFGGWSELRKVIDQLEENENEANFDHYMENRGGESAGEFQHRMSEYQKLK
jgi:hypothetical protein